MAISWTHDAISNLAISLLLGGLLIRMRALLREPVGRVGRPLFAATCSVTAVAIFMTLCALARDLDAKAMWTGLALAAGAACGTALLATALRATDRSSRLTPSISVVLYGIPAVAFALVLTNGWHHQVYSSAFLEPRGPFPVSALEPGFAQAAIAVATFLSVGCAGGLLMVRTLGKWRYDSSEAVIAALGICAPLLGSALGFAGVDTLDNVGILPLSFAIGILALSWGLRRVGLILIQAPSSNLLHAE
jgi:hypothetical protein